MRIVVVGASGNVGTALLRRLADEPGVDHVVGVSRRMPPDSPPYQSVEWFPCDIGADDAVDGLTRVFAGAAAVVHLAWQIQPSHQPRLLHRSNIVGSRHVAEAAVRAGVPALVVASSVGVYSPGPKDRKVDESHPRQGITGSLYSQQKAAVEDMLDEVEAANPGLRVVRMRPGLIFQYEAGGQITRYFLGPWAPVGLLGRRRVPLLPLPKSMRIQCVLAGDVADAYTRAIRSDVRGAFNVAAEPVLDPSTIAGLLHGRAVRVPTALLTWAAAASWVTRLQPTDPGWIWMATQIPLIDSMRARTELGWVPRYDSLTALNDLLAGMAAGAGTLSPALRPGALFADRVSAVAHGHFPGHGSPY
ncbi:NAD-dependent epimerase/dehydratase family protein [Virgisporangium aurantiacum]|uniref:Nucleoside-diphosphate sugar epimerase n=1 Tax=Virgisporangium aurantiacum TaxID=175570 RepID=A0A8J3YYA7_9ACTN|nr:NAD-dependent epimerase/dehydratase family protein [Virgisporangium aurantiacum]GIJ53956.1 nucleoside-diphosphate sugar epimerase [Virgisporangium aurantiacum]